MEQKPHTDRCGELIRMIDHVLAEEGVVLDGLKKIVEQNGMTEQEMIAAFNTPAYPQLHQIPLLSVHKH